MKTELTLEQSAKLIELGVDASLASKCQVQHEADFEVETKIVPHDEFCYEMASLNPQPIFTLTDILTILPKEVIYNRVSENLTIFIDNNKSTATYPFYNSNDADFESPELIDSLYQLLIWTITNGYLNQKKK